MSGRRAFGTLLAAGLLAATVAACGSANASDLTDPSAGETPSELRIANEAIVSSFDPVLATHTEGRRIFYLAYGYLTKLADGSPDLAEKLESSNGDQTWTVTLKAGLKFSDGTNLTADDVVASFERYLTGDLAGTQEVFRTMDSVTAKDSTTVEIQLARPDAEFPQSIAIWTAAIFPAAKIVDDSFFEAPVSAGRYILANVDQTAGTYTLTINPNYHGDKPKYEEIEFTTVPDGATRLAQLRNGQVDYAKSLPANLLEGLPEDLAIRRVNFPGGMIQLIFNNDDPASLSLTADQRIRQAINLAVDREEIARVALQGFMDPLYGVPWKSESLRTAAVERDIEAAKNELQGTECENGCKMAFLNLTDFNWQLPVTSVLIQEQLKDVGIEVELVNVATAQWSEVVAQGGWDGYIMDPGYAVMTAASIGYGAVTWTSPTPDFPELVDLYEELAVASVGDIPNVVGEINQQFADDLPWIPLTTLTFLDVTNLPESAISSPIGWELTI